MNLHDNTLGLARPRLAAIARAAARRPSFRRRIILDTLTAIALTFLLVLLASGFQDYRERRHTMEHEARLLAGMIGSSLTTPETRADSQRLQALLNAATATSYVEAAELYDREGRLLGRSGNMPAPGSDPGRSRTRVVQVVSGSDGPIGEVHLLVSHVPLYAAFVTDAWQSLVALLLAGGVAFGLLYRALQPQSQRLAAIATTLSHVTTSDRYDLRLPAIEPDDVREVAVLTAALNSMLFEIQRHRVDLECELQQRRMTEIQLGKLSKAVENSGAGIFITDADGWIEYANPRYLQMCGYRAGDVIGQPSFLVRSELNPPELHISALRALHEGRRWQGEVRTRRSDGSVFWGMLSLAAMPDDENGIAHFVGNLEDISVHKQAEETINRLAFYDPLTALPNRYQFGERLPELLKQAALTGKVAAVFYLDLDHFKEVNDTLGHGMGDQLLKTAARRLQGCLREHDVVARLGGDEFALVIPQLHEAAEAEIVARKIIEHMTEPFRLEDHVLSVTASVGIAYFPAHGTRADELLKKADIALYRAKGMGRSNYQIYCDELEEQGLGRLELEAQLRQALERREFRLEYQPKLCLRTGRLCGAEALIRWQHPTFGSMPPDRFIPLAEETRLIVPLGHWILDEVARQQALWREAGLSNVPVALNLSTMQFKADDLPARFEAALQRYDLPPDALELEITESLLMDNPERVRTQLAALDAMGIGIAIDDFGTGYSSLSYLKTLPVDVLKIDRSFVHDIEKPDDHAIAAAIIAMAHSLDLTVVAEGAETDEQVHMLRTLGCDVLQGYAYSRPLAAEAFADFMRLCAAATSDGSASQPSGWR